VVIARRGNAAASSATTTISAMEYSSVNANE